MEFAAAADVVDDCEDLLHRYGIFGHKRFAARTVVGVRQVLLCSFLSRLCITSERHDKCV
eukprot:COSAG05_NODE_12596_length_462_cov_0.707989_1_plen_59_part_10